MAGPCPRIEWVSVSGYVVRENGGTVVISNANGPISIKFNVNLDVMVRNDCLPGYIYCTASVNGIEQEFDTYSIGEGDETDMPLNLGYIDIKDGETKTITISCGWIDPQTDYHYETDRWTIYVEYTTSPQEEQQPTTTTQQPASQPSTQAQPTNPLEQLAQWLMAIQPSDVIKIGMAAIAFAVVAGILTRMGKG